MTWPDAPEGVFAIQREYEGSRITLFGNLSREPVTVEAMAGDTLLENGCTAQAGRLTLAPFGYRVETCLQQR